MSAQQLLNIFVWSRKMALQTFTIGPGYFYAPAASIVLALLAFALIRQFYKAERELHFLHLACWVILIVPQMIPPFFYGLNIIYTTWTFVMATSAAGAVVFRDLAVPDDIGSDREAFKFVFDELKFYLDRMSFAWVALGTITGVAMTILWQGQGNSPSFQMTYDERVLWAVYMLFSFITVSLIVVIFAGLPIYRDLVKVRDRFVCAAPSDQKDKLRKIRALYVGCRRRV